MVTVRYMYLIMLLGLFGETALAQNTFIRRYKNTEIAEYTVAVCPLPNHQYAMVGQQTNGFAWQAPIIIITDSAGNQIRHVMDTACYTCDVWNAKADNQGNIYTVGRCFGYAGITKYDTLSRVVWRKSFGAHNALYQGECIINDSIIIAAGGGYVDTAIQDEVLVSAFNSQGDSLWCLRTKFGYNVATPTFGIIGINADSTNIYATGVVTDTGHACYFYTRLNHQGEVLNYAELPYVRFGYDILPINNNEIIIGASGVHYPGYEEYQMLLTVDSVGVPLQVLSDSSFLENLVYKIIYDKSNQLLYTLTYDTIHVVGGAVAQARVSAYQYPVVDLAQPVWRKTVTGTTLNGPPGMALDSDGYILQTGGARENCPFCPYLLKANKDACFDISCDTAFTYTGISTPDAELDARLKLYPNPITDNYYQISIQSTSNIYNVEVQTYNINGQLIPAYVAESEMGGGSYKGKVSFTNNLSPGAYLVKIVVNGKHSLYGRMIKI